MLTWLAQSADSEVPGTGWSVGLVGSALVLMATLSLGVARLLFNRGSSEVAIDRQWEKIVDALAKEVARLEKARDADAAMFETRIERLEARLAISEEGE